MARMGRPCRCAAPDRGLQEWFADQAAARGDDDPLCPLGRRGPRADDEARVPDRHLEPVDRAERLAERGEARIAVHEHGVEMGVGEPESALVVALLVGARGDEDVAQAARGHGAGRAGALEQRHQLARELGPAEREQLDHHHRRPDAVQRAQEEIPADRPRPLDAEARVMADEARARPDAERRQRHDLHSRRRRDVRGHRPAAHEHHAEPLGKVRAERVGPGEVAEADRVLAVEEQRRPGAHAASRSSGSRSRASGR